MMNAFGQHFAFEFRTGLRNKDLLLLNYLFPLGFFLMMGVLMGGINPLFLETMIPAMVIFAILSGAILGLPNPLVEAREAGIFRSFKINGVPALSILTIPALTTMFHGVIVAIIITVTAPLLFVTPLPVDWLSYALVTVVTAFACAGLGALIGVISNNARITILWSQLIYLPSMMLGGMMVPTSMLPPSLAKVSALLPASHAMQAYMGLAYRQTTDWSPLWALIVLTAGGVLAFVMAAYLFNWDSQNSTRRAHPALALLALAPYVAAALILA
jgi:ABC-2 type transport system permease protein